MMFKSATETGKKKRQAIGDEKRKWTIRYYNSDGKPDQKRRPGRAWDNSVKAGPEKATYTAGHGVDLTTKEMSETQRYNALVSPQKAVDHRLAQLSLQSYLEQVHQYEQLLNPLMHIMERTVGGAHGAPPPEQQGWGPVGRDLPGAMIDINAIPRNTTSIDYIQSHTKSSHTDVEELNNDTNSSKNGDEDILLIKNEIDFLK